MLYRSVPQRRASTSLIIAIAIVVMMFDVLFALAVLRPPSSRLDPIVRCK